MKKQPFWIGYFGIILLVLSSLGFINFSGVPAPAAIDGTLPEQVVYLTNLERVKNGLSPLKMNSLLAQAAQGHAEAMAAGDFFDHLNPVTGSAMEDRINATGYEWSFLAENIGAGYETAEDVVKGWMESPKHRENILTPGLREVGIGYINEINDQFPKADSAYHAYWVQDFGTGPITYPIVINNEAITTSDRKVQLFIYGEDWAKEMRLAKDGVFDDWMPFQKQLDYELPTGNGAHTVSVELRNSSTSSEILRAQDDVILNTKAAVESTATILSSKAATESVLTAGSPRPAGQNIPLSMCPGDSSNQTMIVHIPSSPAQADIVLLFDVTGSMSGVLQSAAEGAQVILSDTEKLVPGVNWAIASVSDYPGIYGGSGDHPFQLLQPMTKDGDKIQEALNYLPKHLEGGGDDPEAYGRAFFEIANNPDIGWRKESRRIVIFFGDSIPHDLALDTGADPGPDEQLNTADDINFDQTLLDMANNNITLLHVYPGSKAQLNWQTWAEKTGPGGLSTTLDNSGNLPQKINELVTDVGRTISQLNLEVPPEYKTWIVSKPSAYTSLDIPSTGLDKNFDLQVTIPNDSKAGNVDIPLNVIGDGSSYSLQVISISIPITCPAFAPTFTPTPISTLTPTATPTFAGPQLISKAPAPTPSGGITLPTPTQPLFCSSDYWWVSALLLPLLLILLIILLLWLWSRRKNIAWYNLWLEWKWPCRILSILVLLWLLLLAFLIGRELFVGSCNPTETVYFWRMESASHDFGVYMTNQSENAKPIPFSSINSEGCIGCHSISSTSHQIAAVIGPIPGSGVVYSLSGEKKAIPLPEATYYGWSPDGTQLAFANSAGDIQIVDLQSGIVKPLNGANDPNISETMPAWSSNGENIAFVRSPNPLDIGGAAVTGSSDIYTVPVGGGTAQPVPGASGDGFNYYPSYSPDGRWMAFTQHTTGSTSYSDPAAEIFIIPANGGEKKRLVANDSPDGTTLQNVSNSWPTWSRDGKLLAFNSKRDDPSFDVFITSIDESGDSGPARPLAGASSPGIFEHTPFWGEPPMVLPLWQRLLNLWPWLLPLLLFLILRWLLCRTPPIKKYNYPAQGETPVIYDPPSAFAAWWPAPPRWDPQPTLVIGLGGTGRWVLTHLKKNLLEAGLGQLNPAVRLLLIDNNAQEIVNGKETRVNFAGVALDDDEMLICGEDLKNLIGSLVTDASTNPEIANWFPVDDYTQIRKMTDAQMDARRTTNNRRPMGRAVLFNDIQKDQSRLWKKIQDSVSGIVHQQKARIIIVGSLSGGFGSGVLTDVAYLARRASQMIEGTSVVVTGFLGTDNVYKALSHGSIQPSLNSMAALRELSRFLMANGRPFPMRYKESSNKQVLNGYIEWALFDDVFLFDGQRQMYPLTIFEPKEGTFPLMADLITAHIDRGSQLMEEGRANTRMESSKVQAANADPVISSLGGYTYNLPLYDIVRGLKLRFIRDTLVLFLTGNEKDTEIHFLVGQSQESYPQGLSTLVDHFLRGTISGTAEGVGGFSTFVADLATNRGIDPAWVLVSDPGVKGEDFQAHLNRFQKTLNATVLRYLNGQNQESLKVARAGKLGYVTAFLDELKTTLERARERAFMLETQAESQMKGHINKLQELIDAEITLVQETRAQIIQSIELLSGNPARNSPSQSEPGLLSWLESQLRLEKTWRDDMFRVRVRKTFISDEFLDRVYQDYLIPQMEAIGLKALFWQISPEGRLGLNIRQEGWENTAYGRDDQNKLLAALQALADSASQRLWSLQMDIYFDDVEKGLWEVEDHRRQQAQESSAWAQPVCTVTMGKAKEQQISRYLWANENIHSREAFANQLKVSNTMSAAVQTLPATHPYRCMLITSLDIVPISAFDCTMRLQNEYYKAFNLGDSSEDRQFRRNTEEPVQVFASEKNALLYEQRLGDIYEPARLFHPLFVASIENLERARNFVLAVSFGWVQRKQYQERGQWADRFVLMLPGSSDPIMLTRVDRPNDPVALIVRAMQSYVLGHPTQDRIDPRYSSQDIERLLNAALVDLPPETANMKIAFLAKRPVYLANDNRIGSDDFWSFARFIVTDELNKENG